jgi:hypothetical protein
MENQVRRIERLGTQGNGVAVGAMHYAAYAFDDLAQIAFAGLADAVNLCAARGAPLPPALAQSRRNDNRARGLYTAVERALDDLAGDSRRVAAAAENLGVRDGDIVDAMRAQTSELLRSDGAAFVDFRRRDQRLIEVGRDIALSALLDEVRDRERRQ